MAHKHEFAPDGFCDCGMSAHLYIHELEAKLERALDVLQKMREPIEYDDFLAITRCPSCKMNAGDGEDLVHADLCPWTLRNVLLKEQGRA